MNSTRVSSASDKQMLLTMQLVSNVILGVVDTFGIVGSILSYILLVYLVGSASLYRLLRALAVSDALFLTGHLVFNVIPQFSNARKWPPLLRVIGYGYFATTAENITAWLTVLISVERYVAICKPFRAPTIFSPKNTTIAMVVICSACALSNLPMAVYILHVHNVQNASQSSSAKRYLTIYQDTVLWTQTLVALLIVIVCNFIILVRLQKSRKLWATMNAYAKQERRNTLIPLWVVIMFLLSQVPQKVSLACYKYGSIAGTKAVTASTLSVACSVFNSSVNVIIYFVCSQRIRQKFVAMLMCKCRGARTSVCLRDQSSSSHVYDYRTNNTQEFTSLNVYDHL